MPGWSLGTDLMSKPRKMTWRRRLRYAIRRRFRPLQERINWFEKQLYLSGRLPVERLTLPDFLIVGAQKSGTTWLRNNLAAHPDVFFPEMRGRSDPTEVRYFDQNFHRSFRYYAGLYRVATEKLKGDKSPNYYTLPPERIQLIARLMPEARILFMLRNPIERAWSHALMNLVKLPGRDYATVSPERFIRHFDQGYSKGEYSVVLDRWAQFFPIDQIWVGFYDALSSDPAAVLEQVFIFLGLSTDVNWEQFPFNQRFNPGVRQIIPDEYRIYLENMYQPEIETLWRRFGESVDGWRV